MKIIGYSRNDFQAKNGQEITGYSVYIATDIDPRRGEGLSVEKVYLSDAKIAREHIQLSELLNRNVRVYYNRYGRVDSIMTVD